MEGDQQKPVENVVSDLDKCATERDEYLSGWKRAKADLINYQKDETRRFEEVIKFGYKAIVKDLLAVMDGLMIAVADKNADKGLLALHAQLSDLLKKYGVEKIEVKLGDQFDPAKHEAVAEVESEHPPGTVEQELVGGYTLHGQVVRAIKVNISK